MLEIGFIKPWSFQIFAKCFPDLAEVSEFDPDDSGHRYWGARGARAGGAEGGEGFLITNDRGMEEGFFLGI